MAMHEMFQQLKRNVNRREIDDVWWSLNLSKIVHKPFDKYSLTSPEKETYETMWFNLNDNFYFEHLKLVSNFLAISTISTF